MRRFACLTSAAAVIATVALAPSASATNARACSAPNEDVCTSSSSGTGTNKDRDSNFSTVTQSEVVEFHATVANVSPVPQTIRWTVVLDGPGTEADATLIDEDVALDGLEPQGSADFVQRHFSFQVKHKTWPEGTYFLHVTGAGSETVTATSTFTVAY